MKRYILTAIIAIAAATTLSAQESRTQALINASLRNWEIELRAGYNIGGVSPLPLPEEIRSLDSFNPTVPLSLEADFTKRLGRDNRWGVQFGVKVENKNMTTKATVKNYGMEIIGDDGAKVAGRWTGGVQTAVRNSYLTFPVVGVYRVHPRTNIKAGLFFSWLFDGTFEGYVYDGYLREGDPTGLKTVFEDELIVDEAGNQHIERHTASYDFSDNLRNFQWGWQIGADWTAFKHLKVYADLTWGINNVFHSNFNTITFDMHPIYLNLGVGYMF